MSADIGVGDSGSAVEREHRWGLVSDDDPLETEVCSICGAQRDKNGPVSERARITGGWPREDCNMPITEAVKPPYDELWHRGHEYIIQEGTSFWTRLRERHGWSREDVWTLSDGLLNPAAQAIIEGDYGPALPDMDELYALAVIYGDSPGALLDRCCESKGRELAADDD